MTRADLIMGAVMAVCRDLFPVQSQRGAVHILTAYTDNARRLPGFLHAKICSEFSKLSDGAA